MENIENHSEIHHDEVGEEEFKYESPVKKIINNSNFRGNFKNEEENYSSSDIWKSKELSFYNPTYSKTKIYELSYKNVSPFNIENKNEDLFSNVKLQTEFHPVNNKNIINKENFNENIPDTHANFCVCLSKCLQINDLCSSVVYLDNEIYITYIPWQSFHTPKPMLLL